MGPVGPRNSCKKIKLCDYGGGPNFVKNYHYIVAKMKCWQKLLLSLLLNWNVVRNKPSFSINLVIKGVANTALSQKILGQ